MIKRIKKLYIDNQEIINYVIVGGLTTVVSFAIYYGLVFTLLDPNNGLMLQIANILSWIGAVTFAYFTNRSLVFKSENKNILKEGLKFYSSRLLTLFIDMAFMFVFVTLLSFNDKICKIIVQFVVLITNYIISKFIVFKNKNSYTD